MKPLVRLVLINAVVAAALYCTSEAVYSTFAYLNAKQSVWVAEDSGRTIHYDPVKGFILTETPSRYTRITDGIINSVGTFQGNAQGFPDRDDFPRARTVPEQRRYVVFGDSFTAGNFLARNWPDRAEDLLRRKGMDVMLPNLSGDGWGLGNWASIMDGMLQQENYEIDGLIFAVWTWDLARPFYYSDHRGQDRRAAAPAPGWDPATHPKSTEEALANLAGRGPQNSRILSTEAFDAILRGETLIEPKWRFALFEKIKDVLRPTVRSFRRDIEGQDWERRYGCLGENNPEKLRLYRSIKNFASARGLPVIVVYIWSREGLINGDTAIDLCRRENARHFARQIGAEFADGGSVFEGVSRDQLKQLWLPNDGHWGQGGSDLFASFMVEMIEAWN